MSIYRGDGGAGNADDDATVNAVAANAVAAASSAAEAAVSASNAAISASAANTKANEAAVSAASASTASASASAAASSEANAAASASSASTSASNAATSAATAASIVGSGNGIFTVPVSYTSTLTGGTGIVNLGSGQFYKDASGNIGIGVTPSAWSASWKAMQYGVAGSIAGHTSVQAVRFSSNEYDSDVTRYIQTSQATRYEQYQGLHKWYTAPSGTAGAALTFYQQLSVTNTTSAVNYTQITGAVTGSAPTLSAQGSDANIDITLTPKGTGRVNISTSIKPKVSSTTSVASPLAWNSTSFDEYALTALANALTISADANTSPADGQRMLFRFKDNGTARVLTWTTGATRAFRAIGVVLPTTTVVSKLVYVGCVYNAADSRWDVLAVGQEA